MSINSKDFITQALEINSYLKRLKYRPEELTNLLGLSINTMRKHRANGWISLDVRSVHKLLEDIENRLRLKNNEEIQNQSTQDSHQS